MSRLKRAWRWVKRHWKVVAATVGIILAAIAGIVIAGNVRKRRKQEHKIKVLKAEKEVAKLEGKREVVRRQENAVAEEVEKIDAEIEAKTEEIKRSRAEIDRLSSKEKLKEFKDLGYGGGE